MFESAAPKYKFGGFGGSSEKLPAKEDPKPKREFEAGANPTITIYNASVVKIFNASNSIACLQNKDYFSTM
jgi:hypothetical protein